MTESTETILKLGRSHLKSNDRRRELLLHNYPHWKQDDARKQILERLKLITMATLGFYVARRDYFTQGSWWARSVGLKMEASVGETLNNNIDSLIKLGWIAQSFALVENAYRITLRVLLGNEEPRRLIEVERALHKRCDVEPTLEQGEAMRLLRLTRNTVHNNSLYGLDRKEKVCFLGKMFRFRKGHKVNYAEFSVLFPMMSEVEDLVCRVVTSRIVGEIEHVPDDVPNLPGIMVTDDELVK